METQCFILKRFICVQCLLCLTLSLKLLFQVYKHRQGNWKRMIFPPPLWNPYFFFYCISQTQNTGASALIHLVFTHFPSLQSTIHYQLSILLFTHFPSLLPYSLSLPSLICILILKMQPLSFNSLTPPYFSPLHTSVLASSSHLLLDILVAQFPIISPC